MMIALFALLGAALGVGAVAGLIAAGGGGSTASDRLSSDATAASTGETGETAPAAASGLSGPGSTPSPTDTTALQGSSSATGGDAIAAAEPTTTAGADRSTSAPTPAPSTAAAETVGTCRINLLAQALDEAAIDCDRGTVTIEGDTGRWHNDIRAVFLTEGTTGLIYFEPRADGTFDGQPVVDLGAGTNRLNVADARYGVSLLTVEFTGEGQHLHLIGDDGSRGQFTATYSAG